MTTSKVSDSARCVLSGVALAAAQPGFDHPLLAWIGLVPLLLALRGAEPRRAFRLAWLAGSVYYALILYWIAPTIATYTRIQLPVAIVLELLLSGAAGVFIGTFGAALEWLAGAGISRVLSAPALWIASLLLPHARSHPEGRIPLLRSVPLRAVGGAIHVPGFTRTRVKRLTRRQ